MKLLKIGADPFPPYQYINDNQEICGKDYKKVKSVIEKMPYCSKFIIDKWKIIENMFENKELDIIFQIQKTPKRMSKYYFSSKLRDAITSIITSKDNNSESYCRIEELLEKKYKIGVLKNYQYGNTIDSINERHKIFFDSTETLIAAVNKNKLQFGVVDLGVFNHLNDLYGYENVLVINDFNFVRPLYVAFNDDKIRNEFEKHYGKEGNIENNDSR